MAEETGGGWVVEGGGGGSGLHSRNGMREPLSNRCRGGARSPRWLLRTLMSFSLAPPLSLPSPPSRPVPVRPATHSTAPASSSSTFAVPRATRRRCRHRRCSFSLPLPYSAVSHDGRRPSLACLPFVLSGTERGGHDTCQSTADARSIPTDLGFSLDAPSFALLPTTATLPLPLPVTLLTPPFILYPSLATEHPATNLLRIPYARLVLDV